MEYLISNNNFEGAHNIGNIFVKGEVCRIDHYVTLCEGYILDDNVQNFEQYILKGIESYHADGIYVIIQYDVKSNRLVVKGDYNGLRSVYIYENNGCWAISNNVWLLVKQYKPYITINQDSLMSQIVFVTDVVPGRTVFNSIKRLNYGEKAIWNGNGVLEYSRYWDFNHLPDDVNEQQILRELDELFTKGFSLIKERNPGLKMGIGCSGGLDSRIIMHYANKIGIEHVPFVFCQKQKIKGINTATYCMSDAVASYFGENVIQITTINQDKIEDSILLDLRNQPFGSCELSKNPYDVMPEFDYMMTGQPGALTFADSFLTSDNIEDIISYTSDHLGTRMYAFDKIRFFIRKFRLSFPIKYNPSKEEGFSGLSKSFINRIISEDIIDRAKKELHDVISALNGKSNYERWFRLQSIVVNSFQYGGGYESLNNLKKSYYLYLLGWNKILVKLGPDYLLNKKLLKMFINYINPGLAEIPDQHLNRITDSKLMNYFHQFEYIIRGQGINTETLVASRRYQEFAKKTMCRENPLFYANISKRQVLNNGILKTQFSPTLVKRKLMLDIFYYDEFDKLLHNDNWVKI